MRDREIRPDDKGRGPGHIFQFDPLLLIFLIAGWLLIFASASVAVRRSSGEWLPVELVPQVSANYSVDAAGAPRLAPIRPQIVEAVRQDALVAKLSPSPEVLAEATPEELPPLVFRATRTPTLALTPTLTSTATLSPAGLIVSPGGPYSGEEGNPVALMAKGASLSPGTISYRWDLDEDGVYDDAAGSEATVVFYDEGEYVVGVEATDAESRVAVSSTLVSVINVAPLIDGLGDQYAGEGERVSFSARVVDPGHDVLIYAWDFGDGGGDTGTLEARHTYVDEGDYPVRFRAEDNDGGVTEVVIIAHVANQAPRVDAGPDRESDEGAMVTFSGSASDAGVTDRLSYAWDLDYDGGSFRPDAYGPTASRVYRDGPAEVVAALRVKDGDGGQSLDTVRVRVNNVAPRIVSVANDGPVGEGSPLTVVVEAADVGEDTLSYAFDWENDGIFEPAGPSGRVTHTWYDEGEYRVGVMADDGDGGQARSTTLVTAYNVAPRAVAGVPASELEGRPVTFDGGGSSDPGMYDVLEYEWDFGDGSPVVSGTLVTHAYADNRVYSATLTVRDDSGAAGRDGVAVSILNANPVAEAGSDEVVDEGDTLRLTGTASDPGFGDALSVAWDLDYDGSHFDEDRSGTSTLELSYGDGPASYVVAYRVRDDDYPYPVDGGGEIGEMIDTLEVTVYNVPPVADAGGPYEGQEGEPIALTGAGFDVPADVLTYEWDVDGDGRYDLNGPRVSHPWPLAGEYEVTLWVTDDDGDFGLDTAQVSIGNAPPVAEAGGPYPGDEGSPIVLTGGGTDPTDDPLTFIWDLNYDGVFETPGQVVTNTWPDNGVFTVTLRVDDGRGGVDTDDAIVTVLNIAPVAEAGPDRVVAPGELVTFNGTAIDPGADTHTYEWDFDYDGSVFDVQDTGQTVTTSYASGPATYVVALRVTDDDGGIGFDTASVDVTAPPVAAEAGGPYEGYEGSPIVFTGSGSPEPLTYAWDFGYDGVFETPGQAVTYTWPDDSSHRVTLRVDDGQGGVATDDATVTVYNVAPTAYAGGPYTSTVDIVLTLVATATDVPSDTLIYAWDMDYDGLFDDRVGRVVTYTWVATGVYTVTLQVSDDDGGVTGDTTTVNVNSLLYPFAWLGVPYLLALSKKAFGTRRRTNSAVNPGRRLL